ncbi:MAG: TonB-dependent receptor [Acidobacteria bacterium]|nr:TonB-dependent receptor [Acidobacteriota bacterium]MCB9398537.1 TonB-dependent receptor [Acidobacteriota bacterium]
MIWCLLWLVYAPQSIELVVVDGDAKPLAGVRVLWADGEALTDGQGRVTLLLAPASYSLTLIKPGYLTVTRKVVVVNDSEMQIVMQPAPASFGEELVVIGNRVERTALETPAPVDVFRGEDITQTGATELGRALQAMAPSFHLATSTISDGTDSVRPMTLRGLGPDQTLVLLQGKRRHHSALVHVNGSVGRGSAGVDLNAIPSSAIDKIEILRDGASAQYGSDAIAGVINLSLRSKPGTRVQSQWGETYEGDGETVQLGLSHGMNWGDGFFLVAAELRNREATNRAGLDPRQQYRALPDGAPDPREMTIDRLNHRYGDADSDNTYFFLNGSRPFSAGTFYLFGGLSQREGESGGFFRRALDARTVPEIHPDGFLPLIQTDVDDFSFGVGFKTVWRGSQLDFSLTSGENQFDYHVANSNNVSMGPNSPTEADAGGLALQETTLNLDGVSFGEAGGLGALTFAYGLEWRRENYQIKAGEPASYIDGGFPDQFGGTASPGIQVFPGFRPSNEVDEDRDNLGLYGQFSVQPKEKWETSLALRYEDLGDFGDNLSGKLASRYELTDHTALRGALSTGYRAPSLHQVYFNNTSTQFVFDNQTGGLIPFEVGTFRNDSAVATGLGIPQLKPETSQHLSLGFTARPRPNLQMSLDFFAINIDERIVLSGLFRSETENGQPVDGPIGSVLNPLGVAAAQFFTNAVDTETRGADLVVSYVPPAWRGLQMETNFSANWSKTEVVGEVKTPGALAGLGETLFDRIERERIESAQPRVSYDLNLNLRHRWGDLHLHSHYYGSVKTVESAANPDLDQTFSGKWITDLDLGRKFGKSWRINLGAQNIFDVYPDRNRDEISFNGIFPYPRRTAPFGFNGGSYYLRLEAQF